MYKIFTNSVFTDMTFSYCTELSVRVRALYIECVCCQPFNIINSVTNWPQFCKWFWHGPVVLFWHFEKSCFISLHSIMHAILLFYHALSAVDKC